MKSIASSPRNSWKGQEEEVVGLSIMPRIMRPLAIVAAFLIMALVVLPTAGVAVAGDRYNDDDDDDDDDNNNIPKIALIALAVAGLIYFTSGDDDDDDELEVIQ